MCITQSIKTIFSIFVSMWVCIYIRVMKNMENVFKVINITYLNKGGVGRQAQKNKILYVNTKDSIYDTISFMYLCKIACVYTSKCVFLKQKLILARLT